MNPMQFQIQSLISSGQKVVINVLPIRLTIFELEVFDAGLTILHGKSLTFDYIQSRGLGVTSI